MSHILDGKVILTAADIPAMAGAIADKMVYQGDREEVVLYPIPRGGVPVAYALMAAAPGLRIRLTSEPSEADYLVDDLIDSGETMQRVRREAINGNRSPGKAPPQELVLIDKTSNECPALFKDKWLVFPWEGDSIGSLEDNVRRTLQFIGDDPTREGLLETPARVAKAWVNEWGSGYAVDPAEILKTFKDGAEGSDEMVMVQNIPFYTHCEHHMAPFFGTATVAYIPNGHIVGLSKLSRLVDCFARRLQVQERLTTQIADALQKHLEPLGVGVVLTARHLCMESRGVRQQGHSTRTSALRGVMKDDAKARAEFMALSQ